jgi:hypothetical protein
MVLMSLIFVLLLLSYQFIFVSRVIFNPVYFAYASYKRLLVILSKTSTDLLAHKFLAG